MNKGYAALASSVLLMAERDLRKAKEKLARNPNSTTAKDTLEEIGRFLKTDWAITLEGIADVNVVDKLKEMLNDS